MRTIEHCPCVRPPALQGSAALGNHAGAAICVVDEDCQTHLRLSTLVVPHGLKVLGFTRPDEFFWHARSAAVACLILAIGAADFDAADLATPMQAGCPVIVVSDHCHVPTVVKAIKAGAVDFLLKPLEMSVLAVAVHAALDGGAATRAHHTELERLRGRFTTLSIRERQVLALVIGGMRNKQAAAALGIQEVTLQVHRSRVMQKMGASSFAQLVRMGIALDGARSNSSHLIPQPLAEGRPPRAYLSA